MRVIVKTICRADPNFTANPKLQSPLEKAFLAASYNAKHLKTLNVFLDLVDIPSNKKMEYVKTVVETQDDKFSVNFEGFKKQLSSLPVAEVDAFDN